MQVSTKEIVMAALFTALLCVLTILVRVLQPVMVVPFSLQPLVVMIAACVLKPRIAALSMLAYILLGLIGLPVLSSPPYGGPAYVFLPTFGFLLAYPFAAYLQSKCIRRTSFVHFLLAGIVGVVVIYVIGLPYLYAILNFYLGKSVDIMGVLTIGFFPFVTFDLIKAAVAALIALEICKRLDIRRENMVKPE